MENPPPNLTSTRCSKHAPSNQVHLGSVDGMLKSYLLCEVVGRLVQTTGMQNLTRDRVLFWGFQTQLGHLADGLGYRFCSDCPQWISSQISSLLTH